MLSLPRPQHFTVDEESDEEPLTVRLPVSEGDGVALTVDDTTVLDTLLDGWVVVWVFPELVVERVPVGAKDEELRLEENAGVELNLLILDVDSILFEVAEETAWVLEAWILVIRVLVGRVLVIDDSRLEWVTREERRELDLEVLELTFTLGVAVDDGRPDELVRVDERVLEADLLPERKELVLDVVCKTPNELRVEDGLRLVPALLTLKLLVRKDELLFLEADEVDDVRPDPVVLDVMRVLVTGRLVPAGDALLLGVDDRRLDERELLLLSLLSLLTLLLVERKVVLRLLPADSDESEVPVEIDEIA